MIIDFHTHILPQSIIKERDRYLALDATLGALFVDPRAPMATADELVAAMDEAQVDMAVTLGIGWNNPELAREVNDYLLESAARYPRRLVAFCSVNPAWG
ncbi:MAG: amidohydrolase, partial [Dehalococcoidia bacterium]